MRPPQPLRLHVDLDAVAANWRALQPHAPAGAAIKADGYGLGAAAVLARLAAEGCRDFFVATCAEAAALGPTPGLRLHILHGCFAEEIAFARAAGLIPVLNTAEQARAWQQAAPGRACDLMIDTGINRLGLAPAQAAALAPGLAVDLAMSHLACADEPASAMNAAQRDALAALGLPARRRSLANSAGIALGPDYTFDLTRPGIGLYAGDAPALAIEARVVQRRDVPTGGTVGYGATWTARRPTRLAIANIGYADGLSRRLAPALTAEVGGTACPLVGLISMDLAAFDITNAAGDARPEAGDWLAIPYPVPALSAASGIGPYELLTNLGARFDRHHHGAAAATRVAA